VFTSHGATNHALNKCYRAIAANALRYNPATLFGGKTMKRATLLFVSMFLLAGCDESSKNNHMDNDRQHRDGRDQHDRDRDHRAHDNDRDRNTNRDRQDNRDRDNRDRDNDRNRDRDRGPGARNSSTQDAEFLRDAAMANMTEIELGQAAQQNAQSDEVRRYGQRMVDDHGKAQFELRPLARRLNVDIPERLDGHHQDMVSRLSQKTGPSFDRDYVSMMANDHQTVVSKFEDAAQNASDNDVRAFANKMLPTLREHLRMAQDLNGRNRGTR
jgi:putative membrane protein